MAYERDWPALLPVVDYGGYGPLLKGTASLAELAYLAVRRPGRPTPEQAAALKTISDWSPELRRVALLRAHWDAVMSGSPTDYFGRVVDLLDHGVAWSRLDLMWSLFWLNSECGLEDGEAFQVPARIAARLSREALDGLVPVLRGVLDELLHRRMPRATSRALVPQVGATIDRVDGDAVPAHLLHDGDSFGPQARRALATALAAPGVREAFLHAATLDKPVPSRRWSAEVAALSVPAAVRRLLELFVADPSYLHDDTDDLLRGLTHLVASEPSATELLAAVAEAAATGYPNAPKTAAAAVSILAGRDGDSPARTLARLSLTVRDKALLARVRSALDQLGAARGWAPGVAQELAVDDHDLDANGQLRWQHEDLTVVLEVTADKPRLRYERSGVPLNSVAAPALAKDRLKRLTATFAVERTRVESLLAEERVWSLADWTSRYLRHPVTGVFARRLIWEVSGDGERWLAAVPDLDPSAFAAPATSVRLWHPLDADPADVAAWRDRIGAAGLSQPFKQAFREIYRITRAEVDAVDASSRFAGHILRYRQANALMRTRGWQASYLGTWDGGDESEATRLFGAGTWRASFSHGGAGAADPPRHDIEYCSTGTIQFARRDGVAWTPAPLADVPPRAFSEAMRDVDLFVGVTSIGTDDAWADRTDHLFFAYWADAGFGALTSRAQVRRDALARILPKLRIADRCELGDRFLRVAGRLRAYKIHLGSGNILMEPNDAYLCIVPTRSRPTTVTLPFDDDPILSVILSKAMLLAADDKITDPAIRKQITAT